MTEYKRVRELFDQGAADYDALRRKLIPCFDDFYGIAVELIAQGAGDAPVIADLGAGSGLLSGLVLEALPDSRITLIDLSDEMLSKARERFAGNGQVDTLVADYSADGLLEVGGFSAIISALSIHHLNDQDKRRLYSHILDWLRPGGVFVNADQVLGATNNLERHYRAEWLRYVRAAGLRQDQLDAALERMEADQMAPLRDQLDWLREAGFADADCAYKNFSFAVMWGQKAL